MRRLKIIGLMVLALFALGAYAASMASAEEKMKEGVLPTGAASPGGSGGVATLETLREKETIKCTSVTIGELKWLKASDIHGLALLQFSGCAALGIIPASSLGDSSGVILEIVLFLVCLANPKKLVFGLLSVPDGTNPVHIEVPGAKDLLLVKGAVIAELEGEGLEGKEFKFKLVGTKGDQTTATACFLEDGTELKHTYESSKDSLSDEMASQESKFAIKFNEIVKLMDAL